MQRLLLLLLVAVSPWYWGATVKADVIDVVPASRTIESAWEKEYMVDIFVCLSKKSKKG